MFYIFAFNILGSITETASWKRVGIISTVFSVICIIAALIVLCIFCYKKKKTNTSDSYSFSPENKVRHSAQSAVGVFFINIFHHYV